MSHSHGTRQGLAAALGGTALACVLLAGGCGNPDNDSPGESRVREEARELVAALGDYSREQRDEVSARLEDTLDEVDARIAELRRNLREGMDDASDSATRGMEQTLDDLREQRRDLADRIQDLQDASADTWNDVKARTAEALESVAQALEDAEP